MGKNLKGKELGVGISQRKDGLYTGRFTDRSGKRRQKYFKKLQECRKWIADAQFEDGHGSIGASSNMTVDAWFEYWISEIKEKTVRWSTLNGYRDRYEKNIRHSIGRMIVSDVKPMHCQSILNAMDNSGYSEGSMDKTRMVMSAIFSDACENGIIQTNPVAKSVRCPKKEKRDARVLTIDEQDRFLEVAKKSVNYSHFLFVLQTGIRSSELRGLRWSDIDFEKRVIHIRRNAVYNSRANEFIIGELKTKSGVRDIPMTETAYRLLLDVKNNRTKVLCIDFSDHIFLNKNGKLTTSGSYNKCLKSICDRAGIERIGMHTLRHSFATRCIEAGMRPKTLQKILGHSNLSVTMDLYVHVTDDEKEREMKKFEDMYKMVY